ncbi:MAG: methyltransferase domain-containing protein [Nanoarchaeota archaeon]|nr:methyltransferase domain-containing protein [Nanoarchaeota archaeon]
MKESNYIKKIQNYYQVSKLGYNVLMRGSKHFGFYPKEKNLNEKQAQIFMQDLIGKKLDLSFQDRVLDAGCGQGIVSTYLAKKYDCKIHGITVVKFEVEKSKALARRLRISEKTNYSLMDYSNMKFKNSYFDCVYIIEALSHSEDVKRTLKEFYRVLKEKGRITLFEYTLANDKNFSERDRKMMYRLLKIVASEGLKDIRGDEFQKFIKNIGFKKIKKENVTENMKPSLRRLRNYAFLPYYFFIKPLNLQEKFPNVSMAVEFYNMEKKDLIHYHIFTASK